MHDQDQRTWEQLMATNARIDRSNRIAWCTIAVSVVAVILSILSG